MPSETFNTAGTFSWTPPNRVTSVRVQCWAAGGGGGGGAGILFLQEGGAGGGGGAYSESEVPVTPGVPETVVVGAAGIGGAGGASGGNPGSDGGAGGLSRFGTSVVAAGGLGGDGGVQGADEFGGVGGLAASGTGTIKFSGGNGGDTEPGQTGAGQTSGGGSSAGTGANGTVGGNWTTALGGVAPTGGGNGGNGTSAAGGQTVGSQPGGGGGGGAGSIGAGSGTAGTNGGVGRVILTWTTPGGTLLHPPSQIVSRLLISLGLGSLPTTEPGGVEWPAYFSREPTAPDNCITVYDTDGQDDGRSMINGETFSHYGFQIRVRATTYSIGWVKADTIATFLVEDVYLDTVTIEGVTYTVQCIARVSDVIKLGKESPTSKRELFTINALLSLNETQN